MLEENLRRVGAIVLFFLLLGYVAVAADTESEDESSAGIVQKFVQATQGHEDSLRGSSMQVSIDASIPKLKEHGTLKALRRISKVGTIAYHVVAFQGDNTIKTEVIYRFINAEQQSQGDQSIAITPANYKFKSKGEKQTPTGSVYVFQLTPRKKRVGLFKGDLWIDTKTYLPILEKGKLVKNPSIWFKKFEFERQFALKNGVSVPQHTQVSAEVRVFGTVQMNINFSDYQPNAQAEATTPDDSQSTLWTGLARNRGIPETVAWLF